MSSRRAAQGREAGDGNSCERRDAQKRNTGVCAISWPGIPSIYEQAGPEVQPSRGKMARDVDPAEFRRGDRAADVPRLSRRCQDGRPSTSADLILDAALVSRIHCRLEAHDETLEVVDLESTNGTFVNGARVTRAHLIPGDRLAGGTSGAPGGTERLKKVPSPGSRLWALELRSPTCDLTHLRLSKSPAGKGSSSSPVRSSCRARVPGTHAHRRRTRRAPFGSSR